MNTRRSFIYNAGSLLAFVSAGAISSCGNNSNNAPIISPPTTPPLPIKGLSRLDDIGPLLSADENGVMMPQGFSSRIVARSGEVAVPGTNYPWHDAPDGAAVFATESGGWIYVSNSELTNDLGGVGTLVFDANANVIDSYSILDGTTRNCAGGAMPWGTWMSCEEFSRGQVWECDPFNQKPVVLHELLGSFAHEAVAYDTDNDILYLTEDHRSGGLYRFVPDTLTSEGYADFSSGRLEIAVVESSDMSVSWELIADPTAASLATRVQVPTSTKFNGGEGIVFFDGKIIFATKGDNTIWSFDIQTSTISTLYEFASAPNPILSGVDNIGLSLEGEPIVSEDGGDLQIIALTKSGNVRPVVQLSGHDASEIAGPAFSPDGLKLYFSSQRGTTGRSEDGITFEISGPFHT